ncbi:MAG TPA: hypothetical protein VFP12_10400 [Allosphingosinicella sp.]|nr:hypothetical protein [Allosphingosinicella sp.]
MAVPVREVRRRSSACTTGSVPVPVIGTSLHGEGRLDVDLHVLVSVLPWVREYKAQPMRLPIWVEGRWSTYVPDGRLLGLARPLCVEVKPLKKLRVSPDLDGRKIAIERALDLRGEDFVIWTELEIRAEPLFPNAKLVWSHAQNAAPTEIVETCAKLRNVAFSIMDEVVAAFGGGQHGWRLALALVGMKVLALDLNQPIVGSSRVRVGTRGWI